MDKADMAVGTRVRRVSDGAVGTILALGADSRLAPVLAEWPTARTRVAWVSPDVLRPEHSADMLAGEL